MASLTAPPRLTFLYPMFFSPRGLTQCATRPNRGSRTFLNGQRRPTRDIHCGRSLRRPNAVPSASTGVRYGTANAPPPIGSESSVAQEAASRDQDHAKEQRSASTRTTGASDATAQEKVEWSSAKAAADKDTGIDTAKGTANKPGASENSPETPIPTLTGLLDLNSALTKDDSEPSDEKPPQLQPPRYEHHFDTYSIMQNMQEGGFSEKGSINIMKATRGLLTANMELARDALLSKGAYEMQSYRFRARCAELRTEIRNARKTASESQQSERNSLQHEVDILSQRINAETAALKDDLKGMFDDRKMAVRKERQETENRIQEVNYKITTDLNSEMKNEVEGLRWVLVRRAAVAIILVSSMVLATLRYSKYLEQREEAEKKKLEAEGRSAGNLDGQGPASEKEVVRSIGGGDNPSFVSLG